MYDDMGLIEELGPDSELLTRPDKWLENEEIRLKVQIDLLAQELDKVQRALVIKRRLQAHNLVALQRVQNTGPAMEVLPLPDALLALETEADPFMPLDLISLNARIQEETWHLDGYDLETSRALRG